MCDLKLALDTNIIVAALRSELGASNALVVEVLQGRAVMVCTTALFLEYEAVLKRPEVMKATRMDETDIGTLMAAIASIARPVEPSFAYRPLLRDADDEMVLEAALNSGATLVTHNLRDFAEARRVGVEVLTPAQTLERMTYG